MASHRATVTTVVFAALSSVPALADTPPYSRLRGSQCRAAGQYCGENGFKISIPCCGGTTCQQGFGTNSMHCSAESTCLAKNDVCGHGGFVISKQCCSGLECKVASHRDPFGDMKCKPSNPFDLRAASEPSASSDVDATAANSSDSVSLRGSQHCLAVNDVCGHGGFLISKQCCSGMECKVASHRDPFGDMKCKPSNPFDLPAAPAPTPPSTQAESTCLAKNDVCGHRGFVISKQCCSGLECKVASHRDPFGDMKCKPGNPFDLRAASEPMPAPSDDVTLAESTMQHADEARLNMNASSGFEDAPLEMPGCLAEDQVCGSGGFKTSKQCCSGMECVPPSSYNPFGDMLCKLRK